MGRFGITRGHRNLAIVIAMASGFAILPLPVTTSTAIAQCSGIGATSTCPAIRPGRSHGSYGSSGSYGSGSTDIGAAIGAGAAILGILGTIIENSEQQQETPQQSQPRRSSPRIPSELAGRVICSADPVGNNMINWRSCPAGNICYRYDGDWKCRSLEADRARRAAVDRELTEKEARTKLELTALERQKRRDGRERARQAGDGNNDETRAPQCAVLNFGGHPAQFCVGDAARNVTGPIDYGYRGTKDYRSSNDPRNIPTTRRGMPGGKNLQARLQARYGNPDARAQIDRIVGMRETDSANRNTYNDVLRALGQVFKERGINVGDAIEKALAGQPGGVSGKDDAATPETPDDTQQADTAAPDNGQPDAAPKSKLSSADEALCAFFAQLELQQPIGHQLPESCKQHFDTFAALPDPSSGTADGSSAPPADRWSVEDEQAKDRIVESLKNGVLPPGMADN